MNTSLLINAFLFPYSYFLVVRALISCHLKLNFLYIIKCQFFHIDFAFISPKYFFNMTDNLYTGNTKAQCSIFLLDLLRWNMSISSYLFFLALRILKGSFISPHWTFMPSISGCSSSLFIYFKLQDVMFIAWSFIFFSKLIPLGSSWLSIHKYINDSLIFSLHVISL